MNPRALLLWVALVCLTGKGFGDTSADLPLPGRSPETIQTSSSSFERSFNAAFPDVALVAQDIQSADLDQNGFPDLLVAGAFGDTLAVLLNPGQSANTENTVHQTYRVGINPGPGNDLPRALAVADFDHDRRLDVAVLSSGNPDAFAALNQRASLTIFLGSPGGRLVPASPSSYTLEPPEGKISFSTSLVATDFNRDGNIDLIAGNRFGGSLTPFEGNGFGRFRQLEPILLPGDDLGPRDLLVLSTPSGPSILAVTEKTFYEIRWNPDQASGWDVTPRFENDEAGFNPFSSLALGDFDADGLWDVAIVNEIQRIHVVWGWPLNGETPPEPVALQLLGPTAMKSATALDWRGIGRDDLVVADHSVGAAVVIDPVVDRIIEQPEIGPRPRQIIGVDWQRRGMPDLLTADENEAGGGPSFDIGFAENPNAPPNHFKILPPESGRFESLSPRIPPLQGLSQSLVPNQFWAAFPDRGTIALLEAPPSGIVTRRPLIRRQIRTRANGCAYPTDIDIDLSRAEILVTCAESAQVFRYSFDGAFLGVITPPVEPGARGFWGIAVAQIDPNIPPTYFLSAPSARIIFQINQAGEVLRELEAGQIPALDLGYFAPLGQIVLTHPAAPALFSFTNPDLIPGASNEVTLAPTLLPNLRRIDAIASSGPDSRVIRFVADGHLWGIQLPQTPVFPISGISITPLILMLEGPAGRSAIDPGNGNTIYALGEPFPSIVEFPNQSNTGTIFAINSSMIASAFNPTALVSNPITHELYVIDNTAQEIFKLSASDRSIVEVLPFNSDATPAPPGTEDSVVEELIGLILDPENGLISIIFPSVIEEILDRIQSVSTSSGEDPKRGLNANRSIPRAHPPVAAGIDPDGGLTMLSMRDGFLITFASSENASRQSVDSETLALSSLTPFLPAGFQPESFAFAQDAPLLWVLLQGESNPFPLVLEQEPTAATSAWNQYE